MRSYFFIFLFLWFLASFHCLNLLFFLLTMSFFFIFLLSDHTTIPSFITFSSFPSPPFLLLFSFRLRRRYPTSCVGDCDRDLWRLYGVLGITGMISLSLQLVTRCWCIDNTRMLSNLALGGQKVDDLLTAMQRQIIVEVRPFFCFCLSSSVIFLSSFFFC